MSNYGVENIKHLDTREAMRERVGVYLGSDDTEGIYQALKEIINNSTDEALAGFGKKIVISLKSKDGKIFDCVSVLDEGRGIPWEHWSSEKDGKNMLVSIFTEAHTGGKFDKGAYKNSSGLNGLGATATCMTAEEFTVASYRDGRMAAANFQEGNFLHYVEREMPDHPDGTFIMFTPDKKVFKNMTDYFSYERVCEEIKAISYLNKGIEFIVEDTYHGKETKFYSKNGIEDFLKDNVSKPLMTPILCSAKDDEDELEIAFAWTGETGKFHTFVNGLAVPEGGAPITATKRKITTKIKSLSGKNFSSETIHRGLVYVVNCKVANPSFANQTKSKINNQNLGTLAAKAISEGLDRFADSVDFQNVVGIMEKYEKAEKAADKAREAVLNHTKEMNEVRKTKLAFINKLSDAEELGEDATLFITEGDSAGSSVAQGRDTKKNGILRVKGKMINSLKAEEEKILANEEIKLLLYALGIDINNYNAKKLRYGKVGICVDQDK